MFLELSKSDLSTTNAVKSAPYDVTNSTKPFPKSLRTPRTGVPLTYINLRLHAHTRKVSYMRRVSRRFHIPCALPCITAFYDVCVCVCARAMSSDNRTLESNEETSSLGLSELRVLFFFLLSLFLSTRRRTNRTAAAFHFFGAAEGDRRGRKCDVIAPCMQIWKEKNGKNALTSES